MQQDPGYTTLAANTGETVLTPSGFKHSKKFINKTQQRQERYEARQELGPLVHCGVCT